MKPILGIDMDDVLIDFNTQLCVFYNNRHGTSFTKENIHTFELDKTWNCSRDQAIKAVYDFYHDPLHAIALPMPGAKESIARLYEKYKLVIVTARPESVGVITHTWIQEHFPNTFADIIFTNHYFSEEKKRSKGDVARELGMAGFIEDALHNAESLAQSNIPVYLLDAPWNQGEVPAGVKRYYSWKEIVDAL